MLENVHKIFYCNFILDQDKFKKYMYSGTLATIFLNLDKSLEYVEFLKIN